MSTTNQRVALITGGNRGLGLQTARELKDQGIVVILGARNLSNGEAAAPIL
jgi:NAD(P)-dependent dehydrogenase (short-subunit alcohol dehydrogenase family)